MDSPARRQLEQALACATRRYRRLERAWLRGELSDFRAVALALTVAHDLRQQLDRLNAGVRGGDEPGSLAGMRAVLMEGEG